MEKEMPANPGNAIVLRIYGREWGNDNGKTAKKEKGGQKARLRILCLTDGSDELGHRHCGVRHAVGEAPLVVVPGQDRNHRAVHDLGLVEGDGRGMRIVVEVDR